MGTGIREFPQTPRGRGFSLLAFYFHFKRFSMNHLSSQNHTTTQYHTTNHVNSETLGLGTTLLHCRYYLNCFGYYLTRKSINPAFP